MAMVRNPSSVLARNTRIAISPRFAQSTRLNGTMAAISSPHNYHLSGGRGKSAQVGWERRPRKGGGLRSGPFDPEQQIHGGLIGGGETVVLELVRSHPAAVGDPHRRRLR